MGAAAPRTSFSTPPPSSSFPDFLYEHYTVVTGFLGNPLTCLQILTSLVKIATGLCLSLVKTRHWWSFKSSLRIVRRRRSYSLMNLKDQIECRRWWYLRGEREEGQTETLLHQNLSSSCFLLQKNSHRRRKLLFLSCRNCTHRKNTLFMLRR